VIHHFRLVLRGDAAQELPLRLRDAEPVERALDVVRDVVPVLFGALARFDEVADVVEIDLVEELGVAPRIQAGSFFIDEMRSTISRFRPLSDLNA